MSSSASAVIHNKSTGEFTLPIGAVLNYSIEKSDDTNSSQLMMNITRTFVPPSGRGKGIGQILCDSAFEYANNQKMIIKPTCEYVSSTYIPKYIKYPVDIISKKV